MASIRRLFELHAETDEGIRSAAGWNAFSRDIDQYGLGSDVLRRTLAGAYKRAAATGGPVQYNDLCAEAVSFSPDQETGQVIQDLRQDAAALRRFVDYVHSRYKRDAPERRLLASGLEDVADGFRAALLHALRLAAKEASAIDTRANFKLLVAPINAALQKEVGPSASIDSKAWVPNPWDWQRVHSHALNVRLARVYVRGRNIQRMHRLYRIDRGPNNGAGGDVHSVTGSGGGAGKLPAPPLTGGAVRHAVDSAAARVACSELYLAHRSGTNPEDCAQAAVPFELEVARMPALGACDAVAASSITLTSFFAACASVPSLTSPNLPGMGLMNPAFAMEEGKFASHFAAGGMPIPAPSALPGVPRAHAATLAQCYAEYQAGSELILSSYMADVCGVHEAEEGKVAGVLGAATLFVSEFIPGQVPLAQLLAVAGRMPENRLLFRHLAHELVLAFADVESQCSLMLVPGSITAENVYLSESGTRLTLRGVSWGDVIPHGTDATESLLMQRSSHLLSCLGAILRDTLVEGVVTRNLAQMAKGGGGMTADVEDGDVSPEDLARREARHQVSLAEIHDRDGRSLPCARGVHAEAIGTGPGETVRVYTSAAASLGVTATDQETLQVLLPSDGGRGGQGQGGLVWLPPLLQVQGRAPGLDVGADAATLATLAMLLTEGRTLDGRVVPSGMPLTCEHRVVERARTGAVGPTRFTFRGKGPGRAVLFFYAVPADSAAAQLAANPPDFDPSTDVGRVAAMLHTAGYGLKVPLSPVAVLEVSVSVFHHNPSPTLVTLLNVCDPDPVESAPVATLRLLAAMYSQSTGMVDGRKAGRGGMGDGDGSGRKKDPIMDDGTFLAVARTVAAVLGLTQTSGASGCGDSGPVGAALAGGAVGPVLMSGKQASTLAYGDVSDTDALAALIAAMGQEPGQERDALGPRGSSAADAEDGAHGSDPPSGEIRWLCQLARHPWFTEGKAETVDVVDDYHAFAFPLMQAQALAHGETAVPV